MRVTLKSSALRTTFLTIGGYANPKWMKDPKLASDPAWSLARAWYVGEVCGKIMTMADKRGLVKASKVVDLLLDPDVAVMKQHYDRLRRMQEVI